ncbi:hypothetical protein BGZ60DRAFT_570792 [Tricladium varicosporioides]|nr:hypothetical protein BGZ60DRAFT_570792 [Hymenoscyphus varicosporioides]
MPTTLSDLKNTVKSAIRSPHDGNKPQNKRRVTTFKEALENLRNPQNVPITCSAFRSFGKCRKEINLIDSNLPAILEGLDMADVQTPMKLMPLMLCSAHWEKTVYYNALFLDWLSVYGSKQDTQHFESIVVDYQSAIALQQEERTSEERSIPSITVSDDQRKLVSAPSSPTKTGVTTNHGFTDLQQGVDQLQIHDKSDPSELGSEVTDQKLPETSILVGMESYASIELGVTKLEILYQENLKCIAMSSNGWRCQEIIHQEQLNKARELLNYSLVNEVDLDVGHLPRLVLCPGHGLGELPQIYSEKWAAFAEQRLSKEEAMSKFNAEFWISVEFFPTTVPNEISRPRSVSSISENKCGKEDLEEDRLAKGYLPRFEIPSNIQPSIFQFSSEDKPPTPEGLVPSRLTKARSADPLNTKPVSLETSSTTSSPMVDPARRIYVFGSESRDTPGASPNKKPKNGLAAKVEVDAPSLPEISPKATTPEEELSVESESGISSSSASDAFRDLRQVQYTINKNLIEGMRSDAMGCRMIGIFTPPRGDIVKIGIDLDISSLNDDEIRGECQGRAIAEQGQIFYLDVNAHFEKIMDLVYLELAHFQTKITCQYRQQIGGCRFEHEHRKWFNVPKSVAVNSIKLWSDFAKRAYTLDGSLKESWERRLTLLPMPGMTEIISLQAGNITKHHILRNARYRDWFYS